MLDCIFVNVILHIHVIFLIPLLVKTFLKVSFVQFLLAIRVWNAKDEPSTIGCDSQTFDKESHSYSLFVR